MTLRSEMDVSSRHTEVSWGAVTYGASVNISLSELNFLPQLQNDPYDSLSTEISFAGSDNESTPKWYAEITNSSERWQKVTLGFYYRAPRIFILEAEAVLTLSKASTYTYKTKKNWYHKSSSEPVCTIPEFTLPKDYCRISFKVKYMECLNAMPDSVYVRR